MPVFLFKIESCASGVGLHFLRITLRLEALNDLSVTAGTPSSRFIRVFALTICFFADVDVPVDDAFPNSKE
jgi:hypothetical protein